MAKVQSKAQKLHFRAAYNLFLQIVYEKRFFEKFLIGFFKKQEGESLEYKIYTDFFDLVNAT